MKRDDFAFFQGLTQTGTTGDAYVSVADINNAKEFEAMGLVVENVGGTNDLDFKITTKVTEEAPEVTWINPVGTPQVDITLQESTNSGHLHITEAVAQVKVYVKSTVAATPTPYAIHIGGRRYELRAKR